MRKYLLLLLLAVCAVFVSKNVQAQGVTTASINGTVTDSKGAVPGAIVTITHIPTGTVYSTSTRNDGRYNLPNLRVGGPYTFKVSFIGYKDFIEEGITLSIGQDQKLNAAIQENATELKEVKVTGTQGKVINASRTGARETVNNAQITGLPTINRSLSDFTKLTPSANGLSFGGRSSQYNNLTVDGALFNNSFGLAGTLGGQTNSQPISLDAIDQIQVDIAPFDVRQGGFTGAGINTVVKSGTNTFKGTVYDYIRGVDLTGYQAGNVSVAKTPFTYRQTGFSLGGPIIKNKLFFFVSGEEERISQPATTYVATGSGASGQTAAPRSSTLDSLSAFLKAKYNYNPGPYQGYNFDTYSNKATVKLDWNIDKNNTLSAKYFYLKSYGDHPPSNSGISNSNGVTSVGYGSTRDAGPSSLPFYASGYRINNNFNIGILELDSRLSSSVSNKLTVGYSALRDFRESLGDVLGDPTLPFVDIGDGTGQHTLTSFGYELYTAGNLLYTNIGQFSDDLSWFWGKHEFTFGTSDQIQSYKNGFAPDYNGLYTFSSVSAFENSILGSPTATSAAAYTTRYSAVGSDLPFAKIKAATYSVYAQDKYHISDNVRLTYGLRLDYDAFPTTLQQNANAAALTFQQGIMVDPSVLPKNRVQFSPRVGFNWDVNGDQQTQVRGGTGLFTGAIPFVWISNQASNNGVLFGSYTVVNGAPSNTPAQNTQLVFNPNVNANRPTGNAAANTSYELDIANPNLKYPKIWRNDVAVDQKLPWGIIGTIEGQYSKDINAIYHENLVLSNTTTTLSDGQVRYASNNTTPAASAATAQNPHITGLYYMTNSNKGYSYFVTGQLQKSFQGGFYANVAYTHSGSQDVNDGGSTASTIWSSRAIQGNPNADVASNSSFVEPNRVIASFMYKKDYAQHMSTSVGLIFEMANNGAVSYVYTGDANNDGSSSNDLIYIPKSEADINLVPDAKSNTGTADQQWQELSAFIKQDKYLSAHQGQWAQRNGVIMPYFKRFDFKAIQDFYLITGKTKNTLEVSIDIINVGNLLNKDWGLYSNTFTGVNSGNVAILKYVGTTNGQPTYSFPLFNGSAPTSSFIKDSSQLSRYQCQIGLRYIFN